ncbi:unnamed protein product, partial [Linum tenue]
YWWQLASFHCVHCSVNLGILVAEESQQDTISPFAPRPTRITSSRALTISRHPSPPQELHRAGPSLRPHLQALARRLNLCRDYLTIAGQTSPRYVTFSDET